MEHRSITVNGEAARSDAACVAELLEHLGYGRAQPGIAVALNGAVVPRTRWEEQRLAEGDRLEIVGAVQGG